VATGDPGCERTSNDKPFRGGDIKSIIEVHVIPVERIDYLESQDDYIAVHCAGRSYLKEQPLVDLEAQLDTAMFVRIHRRYVLNLARLAKVEMGLSDSRTAVLRDGTELPISRTGYARLKELL
jgi:two-component system LytT family response regulator